MSSLNATSGAGFVQISSALCKKRGQIRGGHTSPCPMYRT